MKLLYKFVFFMVFFNITAGLVASLNIFSDCLYSDVYGQIDPDDPNSIQNISATDAVLENIWTNQITGIGFTVPVLNIYIGLTFSWVELTIGLFAVCLFIGYFTKTTPVAITIALIGSIFYFMYVNSKGVFTEITDSMDLRVGYIVLMIGIGVLLLIIITIMDYISGQQSA